MTLVLLVVRTWHHGGMSDVRQDLARIGKALGRARRAREDADEVIHRAAAEGLGPAEITKLLGHELTERTVFRILKGKTQPPSSS
jgi:hypothetical protein